jgi:branched-chain amino acid transport system substrate-binding protein
MNIFIKLANVFALVIAALSTSTVANAAEDILIGYHGPMTGPASWVGLGGRDGALLALEEINAAGGVHGRMIKMISYDDGAKPSEAEAVAKKMISSDKVFAILGGGVSAVAIVVGNEAARGKTPYLNGSGASPKIMDIKSRWVFSGATIDVRDIAESEAAFIGEALDVKNVAIMSATDEFSQVLASTVTTLIKDRYNIDLLTRETYNPGDTDFSAQWIKIRKSNPDLILMFGLYVEAARAIRQARELGIKTLIKGDTSMMNNGLLTIAGPAAEGLIATYIPAYFNGDPSPPMVEFEARYKAKYPSYPEDRPNYVDVFNYGTMYALAEGLKRAGPDATQKDLVLALETIEEWNATDGWAGAVNVIQPLSFNQSHNGNRRMSHFRVVNGAFAKITDFVEPVPSTKFPANETLDW